MKHLNIDVYQPGDIVGTMSADGKVAVFTVNLDGTLTPSSNPLLTSGLGPENPIEELHLSVRPYNILKREGIHTLGALIALYDERGREGLDAMRNMGSAHGDEVEGHILRLKGE